MVVSLPAGRRARAARGPAPIDDVDSVQILRAAGRMGAVSSTAPSLPVPSASPVRRVAWASMVGTSLESFDFYVYSYFSALLLGPLFFEPLGPPARPWPRSPRSPWRSSSARSARSSSAPSATGSDGARRSCGPWASWASPQDSWVSCRHTRRPAGSVPCCWSCCASRKGCRSAASGADPSSSRASMRTPSSARSTPRSLSSAPPSGRSSRRRPSSCSCRRSARTSSSPGAGASRSSSRSPAARVALPTVVDR